ncbi:MAG: pyridoxamine 5'-phosphate oxidase [Betaproteobacteria bacterium]|nr:pyridoxamine 5'-phosphate oxidase [Betaproteobacteria bacterium]
MTSRLQLLIDLLHAPGDIALATHSLVVAGFPFVTSIAFATDEHHRPLMLISRLAEHTKNLIADSRASLLVARELGEGEIARASLIGNVVEVELPPLMVARYLRFHPEAERFLQLGDFCFFRVDPVRIRVVGGFAQAGWLDGKQLLDAPHIPLEDEVKRIEEARPKLPRGIVLLGIDAYGVDYRADAIRQREEFKAGPVLADAASSALTRVLKNL